MKYILLLFTVFLVATFCPAAEPDVSKEADFVARVEKAFTSKDAAALLSLYCFDRTEPPLRQMTEKQLIPELLKHEFVSAELSPLAPDMGAPYTLRCVSYAPNLKPVKSLIVRFKKSSPTTPDSSTMLVGMKDGAFAIVLAAPEPKP